MKTYAIIPKEPPKTNVKKYSWMTKKKLKCPIKNIWLIPHTQEGTKGGTERKPDGTNRKAISNGRHRLKHISKYIKCKESKINTYIKGSK